MMRRNENINKYIEVKQKKNNFSDFKQFNITLTHWIHKMYSLLITKRWKILKTQTAISNLKNYTDITIYYIIIIIIMMMMIMIII